MLLSEISAAYAAKTGTSWGFTVKSKETGNLLKVLAVSPKGSFLVEKLTGKQNVGKESLISNTDKYVLVDDALSKKMARIGEIKTALQILGESAQEIDNKMATLESELEGLEG